MQLDDVCRSRVITAIFSNFRFKHLIDTKEDDRRTHTLTFYSIVVQCYCFLLGQDHFVHGGKLCGKGTMMHTSCQGVSTSSGVEGSARTSINIHLIPAPTV